MTTLEHLPHSIRRKGYAPHYTPSNLVKFQPEMHEVTLELVEVRFEFTLGLKLIEVYTFLDS